MIAAYWSFWPAFVLAAMIPFALYGPKGVVPTLYLPWMVFGGMYWVFLIYSLTILNEYGRANKGVENE